MSDLDFGATIRGFTAGQKVLGRYTLERLLGRGGMGVVWLARDEELERDIALKFLPEVVAMDKEAVRDMKRETRRCLELTHTHIVRIYDFIQDPSAAAIAMEYIDGATLAARKVEQPNGHFEVADLQGWVEQALAALEYAHTRRKVVHRDIKPANLMVDGQGFLKVADFGIAASVTDSVSRVSAQNSGAGTAVYMSPQQMMGEKPAVTDDVYAVGATLYELLTGKPPFYSGNVLLQVQSKVAPTMTERRKELGETDAGTIPPAWEATIAACLAKETKDRPQSAREVAERLGLVSSETGSKQPSGAAATAAPKAESPAPKLGAAAAAEPSLRREVPTPEIKSRTSLYIGLAAAAIALIGGGYYLGVYGPEQRKVELARLEAQRKEAERLATARGGMIIRTEPAGAEVRVGGVGIETSPATLKEMRLGVYEVTLSKPGYETQVLKLGVEENRFTEPTSIALKPSVGSAVLASEPVGLDYELISTRLVVQEWGTVKRKGKTPATLNDLPLGEYSVTTQREGWPQKSATVKVERGIESKLAVDFVGGGLTIASTPEGVDYEVVPGRGVTEGTKYARMSGKLSATLSDLPLGDYTVNTRREGWPQKRSEVKVERGAEAKLAVDFLGGGLALTSHPAGLDYEVIPGPGVTEGKQYSRIAGKTPATLVDLPPGDYTVITRKEGWPEKSERVKIERGIEGKRAVDFVGGGLRISSDPAGLEYEVVPGKGVTEGKKYARIEGKTPAILTDLPLGGYAVTVKRGAWTAERSRIEVARGETATTTVQMMGGGIKIESEPAGVDWKMVEAPSRAVLEVAKGLTPMEMKELPPGRYVIEMQRSGGWAAQQKVVEVKARETSTAAAEFASGVMVITSIPSGAEVYREGEKIGVTPLNLGQIPPGDFKFEFRLKNYRSVSVRGEVRAKEITRAEATLEKYSYAEGERATIPGLGIVLVPIAPATFTMGSEDGFHDEKPVTEVSLTRPYWLGAMEVTQAQWSAIMSNNPSNFKGDNLPVENVSWEEAKEYCEKVTERERVAGRLTSGYMFTLPSEAQWEYACRAGTMRDYAGDLEAMGWLEGNSGNRTHAVGTKQANALGLYDMHGNVWEWCADWYADRLPGGSVSDPRGPASGTDRVGRGGGASSSASSCRSAVRTGNVPTSRGYFLGFRLALVSVR